MNLNINQPIQLTDGDFLQNTHDYFAWMRREAPVYRAQFSRRKAAYLITRYDDALEMIRDPRIAKNEHNARDREGKTGGLWLPKNFRPLMHNMLNTDEPDHRRLRNLVHKAFTPRMIAALEPRINEIATRLLDEALAQGEVDLVQAYALPLPVQVIAEMIGVPPEDRGYFMNLAARIVVNPTPWNLLRAVPAVSQYMKFVRRLAEERRRHPQADLLTGLVQAEDEGERFTEEELLGMVFLLLVAGHETTVSLITNGTVALLQHPDQLARLRANPEMMALAIEELLRFDGPLQTTELSYAREDIELHGVIIPQGAIVLPAILSANRDETVFADPDELDLGRTPNKHLAFGQGIHYCLGAPLARLEAKVAFCHLLERAPGLRLAVPVEQLQYRRMMLIHRYETVPVSLASLRSA